MTTKQTQRLTPEQWAAARRRWERDTRRGFEWLRAELEAELGRVPSRAAFQQMSNRQGWTRTPAAYGVPEASRVPAEAPGGATTKALTDALAAAGLHRVASELVDVMLRALAAEVSSRLRDR